jgi:squalene/oxidosqualene cyclase-like protein
MKEVAAVTPRLERAEDPHLERAVEHLVSLQWPSGHWEAEMVWNTMLLSQYVLTRKITGRWPIDAAAREKIILHYRVTQKPDGSWPMHGEGDGYVFMTTLAYVALRVLGLGPDDELVVRARRWLEAHGGVLAIPSWGKLWLAMVGLYGWAGVNPIPPELFLVPDSIPIHPNNFYCHTRYIYLAIAYLSGKRFQADLGPITAELKRELYPRQDFDAIDFGAHRHDLAPTDLYVRPSRPLRIAYDALTVYERVVPRALRRRALEHCFQRIVYEQEASRGQGISPVNGLLNCLAIFSVDPSHPLLAPSLDAMEAWKWEDDASGIRYCGAHSTAWDTAFVMRAILAGPDPEAAAPALRRAYAWLRATQMQEELPRHRQERREPLVGGWCFSDGQHRWPVSDCTAEALTAILEMHARGIAPETRLSDERIEQAVEFILRRQNADGGFGSYERRRGAQFLEWINPSEMYGNCMTERSYTECTASCVGALARYRDAAPRSRLRARVDQAIARGVAVLRARQRDDGSYEGFWGTNFTYAAFHVIEALTAAGVDRTDPAIARAAEWLLVKQKADGGWGEHWKSHLGTEYIEHPESQAAMTAWALLALAEVIDPRTPSVQRGLARLRALQQPSGAWPRQSQSGVFFQTAMLDYRLYKDMFPTWALARYAQLA